MKRCENCHRRILLLTLGLSFALGAVAAGPEFKPLFNGRDFTGWVNVNGAPETWTFREGVVHCTGRPTGALRTTRQYENFILELEWRHLTSGGNSGVFLWGTPLPAVGVPFLRGIEVQVLDNGFNIPGKNEWYTTHGDVFPIHGATMKPFGRHHGMRSFPSEERSKSSPEWNHYRVIATNGVVRLFVNGKEVSGGSDCHYRKGYLALESEGAPVEFRNVRLLELPDTQIPPDSAAPLDQGWQSFFNHLDLRGWVTNAAILGQWTVSGERLAAKAPPNAQPQTLMVASNFPAAEILFDVRLPKPPADQQALTPIILLALADRAGEPVELQIPSLKPENYQRLTLEVRAGQAILRAGPAEVIQPLPRTAAPLAFRFGLLSRGGGEQFMNFFWRPL